MVVTDNSGSEVAKWTSDGKPHTILSTDGLTDGEVYTFTEYTCYSDGSRNATEKLPREFPSMRVVNTLWTPDR